MTENRAESHNSCLSGFDMDPSVQFFGIDWERVFGRCFTLSIQVKQLETVLKEYSHVELDFLVVNKMLRELAAIEADVSSHSEAVLKGRLSKSQRKLIFDEQLKYAALPAFASTKVCKKCKPLKVNKN